MRRNYRRGSHLHEPTLRSCATDDRDDLLLDEPSFLDGAIIRDIDPTIGLKFAFGS
jgi:hypothetical protein